MARTTWRNGLPLDEADQIRLRAMIRERGEVKTAELIGVAVICVVRGGAGCGLRRGTIRLIQQGLDALNRESRAA